MNLYRRGAKRNAGYTPLFDTHANHGKFAGMKYDSANKTVEIKIENASLPPNSFNYDLMMDLNDIARLLSLLSKNNVAMEKSAAHLLRLLAASAFLQISVPPE